jgi:hypothetical protein
MASFHPMPPNDVASLKAQLVLTQARLERAESFVFDLRLLAAKRAGKMI